MVFWRRILPCHSLDEETRASEAAVVLDLYCANRKIELKGVRREAL